MVPDLGRDRGVRRERRGRSTAGGDRRPRTARIAVPESDLQRTEVPQARRTDVHLRGLYHAQGSGRERGGNDRAGRGDLASRGSRLERPAEQARIQMKRHGRPTAEILLVEDNE